MLATGKKEYLGKKNPEVCAGLVVKHISMSLYFCVFRPVIMTIFQKTDDQSPLAESIQKLLTRWHQPLLPRAAPTAAGAHFQSVV